VRSGDADAHAAAKGDVFNTLGYIGHRAVAASVVGGANVDRKLPRRPAFSYPSE
jgi:hypothetical protein